MRSSYEMRADIKVVRKHHVISLWMGQTAGSLKAAIVQVPSDAVIVDVEEDANGDAGFVFEKEETV